MTHFAKVSLEERDMIPYVMQPSPINSIKIKIYQNRVIHYLVIKNRDE